MRRFDLEQTFRKQIYHTGFLTPAGRAFASTNAAEKNRPQARPFLMNSVFDVACGCPRLNNNPCWVLLPQKALTFVKLRCVDFALGKPFP